jgi:hypothetical protein
MSLTHVSCVCVCAQKEPLLRKALWLFLSAQFQTALLFCSVAPPSTLMTLS